MSSSDITMIPERFCGLRVLLAEDDIMSLQDQARLLRMSSYQVTVTTEASAALSIIKNGQTFDCLLIDGDLREADMEPFLRQVWSRQPEMSIIVMTAYDTHVRIPKESLESGAVLCLLRPSCYTNICDIWKHICRNKISSEENVSEENLHKEDQIDNNVPRVDPEPSAINGSTAINNNILSDNFTDHQALGINSQEHGVSYGDLFPEDNGGGGGGDANDQEDVEIIQKENIGIGATRKEDKGKKPPMPKRKCDQPIEDDEYPTKKGTPKVRISWKGELEDKFQNALKELGDKATSSDILSYMKVPGLTRHHVASHQQKHRGKLRNLEANIAELAKKGTTFQVVGVAKKTSRNSIQPKENAPAIKSSSILRLPEHNLRGILYLLTENIRAMLLQKEAPPLPVPQTTTTPNNNYVGDQGTVYSSRGKGIEIQPMGQDYGNARVTGETSSRHAFGEAMAPLGGTASSFGDPATVHSRTGKGIEIQPTGQVYGTAMVTGESSSHHAFGEAMAPLGGTASSFGDPATVHRSSGKGIEIQPTGQVYRNVRVTGESSSHYAVGEAMAPLGVHQATAHSFVVVGNSNVGGQGTRIHYGNAVMDPVVTNETSPHHAFGEAIAPLNGDNYGGDQETIHSTGVVENSNRGGQGTGIQLMEHDYENELAAMAADETFSQRVFGDAMTPLGGDQGTDDFVNAIEPLVSGEISSQHAFGEATAPLGVDATVASDSNLGYNRLQNGVDNVIFGDSWGSCSNEVQVQFPCFEPESECAADFGGIGVNVNPNQDALDSPEVFSFDRGDLYPSQDVQVNRENLAPDSPPQVTFFELENTINSGSDLDSMPSGPASADFSLPEFPTEENDNLAQSELPGNPGTDLDSMPSGPATADFSIPEFPTEENDNLAQSELPGNSGSDLDSMPSGSATADFSIPEFPTEENDNLAQSELPRNSGSDLDSMPSGSAAADFSIPEFPTEENDNLAQSEELPGNSIFPTNSDAGFIDNIPCDSDLENIMNFFNGNDGNLYDGSFYL